MAHDKSYKAYLIRKNYILEGGIVDNIDPNTIILFKNMKSDNIGSFDKFLQPTTDKVNQLISNATGSFANTQLSNLTLPNATTNIISADVPNQIRLGTDNKLFVPPANEGSNGFYGTRFTRNTIVNPNADIAPGAYKVWEYTIDRTQPLAWLSFGYEVLIQSNDVPSAAIEPPKNPIAKLVFNFGMSMVSNNPAENKYSAIQVVNGAYSPNVYYNLEVVDANTWKISIWDEFSGVTSNHRDWYSFYGGVSGYNTYGWDESSIKLTNGQAPTFAPLPSTAVKVMEVYNTKDNADAINILIQEANQTKDALHTLSKRMILASENIDSVSGPQNIISLFKVPKQAPTTNAPIAYLGWDFDINVYKDLGGFGGNYHRYEFNFTNGDNTTPDSFSCRIICHGADEATEMKLLLPVTFTVNGDNDNFYVGLKSSRVAANSTNLQIQVNNTSWNGAQDGDIDIKAYEASQVVLYPIKDANLETYSFATSGSAGMTTDASNATLPAAANNLGIGDISTLTTTAKTNTVAAINEVDGRTKGIQSADFSVVKGGTSLDIKSTVANAEFQIFDDGGVLFRSGSGATIKFATQNATEVLNVDDTGNAYLPQLPNAEILATDAGGKLISAVPFNLDNIKYQDFTGVPIGLKSATGATQETTLASANGPVGLSLQFNVDSQGSGPNKILGLFKVATTTPTSGFPILFYGVDFKLHVYLDQAGFGTNYNNLNYNFQNSNNQINNGFNCQIVSQLPKALSDLMSLNPIAFTVATDPGFIHYGIQNTRGGTEPTTIVLDELYTLTVQRFHILDMKPYNPADVTVIPIVAANFNILGTVDYEGPFWKDITSTYQTRVWSLADQKKKISVTASNTTVGTLNFTANLFVRTPPAGATIARAGEQFNGGTQEAYIGWTSTNSPNNIVNFDNGAGAAGTVPITKFEIYEVA